MSCKDCGKCCQAIILNVSFERIKEIVELNPKIEGKGCYGFALRNFIPISEDAAFKINPYLKHWHGTEGKYYYRCKMFSEYDKKCSVYEIRPDVCKTFPLENYKDAICGIEELSFYSKDCRYIPEIKSLININKNKKEKFK